MKIWYNPADGTLHDDMDGSAIGLPSWPTGMIEATEEQITAAQQLSPKEQWAEYQAEARSALAVSDTTVMRCYESGIALPDEWVKYRKALRAIVSASSGDGSQVLPGRPAYPSGT